MPICKGLVYAIIPARSGSTSVKDKNIRMLADHPLLSYSIAAAKLVPDINRIIVSTDSQKYAEIAKKYGAEVPFMRPKGISGKYSTDLEFMNHAIKWFDKNEKKLPEYWVHLRPTTPLRNPDYIVKAIQLMKKNNDATSLRSAHKTEYCPFKWFKLNNEGYFESFDGISLDEANGPRQRFPSTYIPNGYVDILKTDYIIKNNKIHGNRMIGFVVPPVVDVDYEKDMQELNDLISYYSGPILDWLNKWKSDSP